MIRARLFAVPLLLLAAASAAPSAGPQTHAQLDVPRAKPQQVIVQSRDFAPGSESGWHVHPGTEVAYIASGRLELHVEGKVTVLEPGYIESEMTAKAGSTMLMVDNETGVKAMVDAIEKEKGRAVVPGWPWWPLVEVMKLVPPRFTKYFA